jgi:two-component system, chemotaxis family, chemotaxis protein CheY
VTAKILIVEDSPSMRALVREALDADGYEVTECDNGLAALAVLGQVAPDLVITDINMPQLDGLGLLREIRQLPSFRFMPVLILTSESGADMKESGRAAGATGWLVKPFDAEQLRRVVSQVLGTRARA